MFFNEYATDSIFSRGVVAARDTISLVVYALEGGLADEIKKTLIREATNILGLGAGTDALLPVYVVINEIPEVNWGMFGQTVSLQQLRGSGGTTTSRRPAIQAPRRR